VSNKKAAAIAEILKVRDQLVVMRERLFQLTAATAARTKKVDGLLLDCAAAQQRPEDPMGAYDFRWLWRELGVGTGVSDCVLGSTENRISGSNPSLSTTQSHRTGVIS